MLSKQKIKFIRSLEQKKFRKKENAFLAEGPKCVDDLLRAGFRPRTVVHTASWESPVSLPSLAEDIPVTDEELRKVSLLQHPQQVLGVFDIPTVSSASLSDAPATELVLALDSVQDPGNLGTIIRTADWFGIRNIVCTAGTADAFNPKVVQATMGSIARLNITYFDTLCDYLSTLPSGIPVYGAVLDGENIYTSTLTPHGVIIMGNEGNGISAPVREMLTHKLLIPQGRNEVKGDPTPSPSQMEGSMVKGQSCQLSTVTCQLSTAESLNVSIATAIILSEFRRRG